MNNIFSVIDLGTNNVQILIAEKNNKTKIIYKDSFVTELGKNFKNFMIDNDRIEYVKEILVTLIKKSKKYTDNIVVIGTSLAREAKNIFLIKDFLKKFGVKFFVISGSEEAYLNGLANLEDFTGDFFLFDIGGGSTEFTFVKNNNIIKTVSIPIGIRRLDEGFCNIGQKIDKTRRLLNSLDFDDTTFYPVGIGGTVSSLVYLIKGLKEYQFEKIHKQKLLKKDVFRLFDDFVTIHIDKYKDSKIFNMFSLELLATGTMIVKEILDYFNKNYFFVSDKNLMFGALKSEKYFK